MKRRAETARFAVANNFEPPRENSAGAAENFPLPRSFLLNVGALRGFPSKPSSKSTRKDRRGRMFRLRFRRNGIGFPLARPETESGRSQMSSVYETKLDLSIPIRRFRIGLAAGSSANLIRPMPEHPDFCETRRVIVALSPREGPHTRCVAPSHPRFAAITFAAWTICTCCRGRGGSLQTPP